MHKWLFSGLTISKHLFKDTCYRKRQTTQSSAVNNPEKEGSLYCTLLLTQAASRISLGQPMLFREPKGPVKTISFLAPGF